MFVGREEELNMLRERRNLKDASFIVLKGRRRIGKSRLIREYSKEFPRSFFFTGLPPTDGITSQDQKNEFIRQMGEQGLPRLQSDDWGDIFWILSKACEQGSVLIALDEISWMGSKDKTFLGKLKVAWDTHFEKNSKLILIVAGSISSWIDKNIIKSTGFLGRIDLSITLKELPVRDCVRFWGKKGNLVSAYEKLKVLGVTGGVPRYLMEIQPQKTAEQNISSLCFSEGGLLANEFEQIFHDLFSKKSQTYRKIVETLIDRHSLTQEEISNYLGKQRGRILSTYLEDLVTAGFLSADYTWDVKTKKISKLRKYRVSDNYLRFYLKYIAPNKEKLRQHTVDVASLFNSGSWEAIMGLQFENLVMRNSRELLEILNISPSEWVMGGPYFQRKTQRHKGCQIDFLIQTKSTLCVCEIKFSRNPLGAGIIEEVQEKIEKLIIPKLTSVRPVLIHIGGVKEEVKGADFFDSIIDWTQVLTS